MKTKIKILILFLAVIKQGYAQILFQQDFSSSTSVSSYVNSASPSANQFNGISNFANSPSAITNNALRFSKNGSSSAFFVRTTPLASEPSDFVKFQFKLKVSEPATLNNYTNCKAALYIGNGTDEGFSNPSNVVAPVTASIHTRLDIELLIASGSAKFSVSGKEYSGEQTITLFINNTGDTIPKYYTTPGGNKSMVANDKFDVWVGNDLVINEGNAVTATANINKFKFILPSCSPNVIIDIDDILIRNDAAEESQLWISTVKYQNPASQIYLGSPSLLRLSNGDILASNDYFGPNRPRDAYGRSNRTSIYKSTDDGATWTHVTDIAMYWANLFEHKGDIYLLGTTTGMGSIAIRKSTDNGVTWTTPASSSTGLLFNEGPSLTAPRYHGAPTPVLKSGGRLYRAFENVEDAAAAGFSGYRALVISIDEDDDLLDATKWTKSNELTFNKAWDPPGSAATTGWLEGNMVEGPDGKIWNMPRVNSTPFFGRSALLEVTNNGQTLSFNPTSDFINFPGGSCKFVVRKDASTNIYWAMLNDNTNGVQSNQRNVLALYASLDLRNWYHAKTLMEDNQGFTQSESIALTGFQYPDWQFDGDHMIYLSRNAYGDGAPNSHDSNYITFGRVEDYKDYTPQELLNVLNVGDFDFSAKKGNNGVELRWKNSNGISFSLSKRNEQSAFTLLEEIKERKTGEYLFIDDKPYNGINIYRLISTDKDGKTTNKEIAVNYGIDTETLSAARAQEGISVFINATQPEISSLLVTDITGRMLFRKEIQLEKGNNVINVPIHPQNKMLIITLVNKKRKNSILIP